MAEGIFNRLLRWLRGERPAADVSCSPTHPDGGAQSGHAELALVYRGPAASPGCPEAVAAVLAQCGLRVRFTGPREQLPLDAATLAEAAVYAHPGGDDLDVTWPHMKKHRKIVREFVEAGGVYLGFCLGAYLAGRDPGFGLLPGDTDQYCTSGHSEIPDDGDHVVTVDWRGTSRSLYFQDGPWFDVPESTAGLDVLARYRNGLPAAVVLPVGEGVVGLVGPHPEATSDWFRDVGLRVPRTTGADLAEDLVVTALTKRQR